MTTTSRLVPDEKVKEFREKGFVVLDGLVTEDELDHYGALVTAAVEERAAQDTRTLAEKSRYEQSFIQIQNLWESHDAIRPLSFHPRIAQAAAELLGVEAIRMWHDQALFKEPGGRETDAHQDQPYWPIDEPVTVTAWIPFEGSTLESGAMGYVPGSHRVGVRKFVNIFWGEPEDLLARPELEGTEPEFVEVPKGSIAFHHGLTAHLARPNRTTRARSVHTIIFFGDGCHRLDKDQPHPSVDRNGIAKGARIDGDVTPIAWPRPDGDLPPVPADYAGNPFHSKA